MKALLLLSLLAGPLSAQQDPWQRQVDSSLVRAATLAANRGYTATGQWVTSSLFMDESERRDIPLSANSGYLLVGVCDRDCSEFSLSIASPTGDDMAADTQSGNAPFLEVKSGRSGLYRVRVTMRECRVSPCRYGVAVFQKKAS